MEVSWWVLVAWFRAFLVRRGQIDRIPYRKGNQPAIAMTKLLVSWVLFLPVAWMMGVYQQEQSHQVEVYHG